MMQRIALILCWWAGAVFLAPSVGLAESDAYTSGFYTRGVDAATYMDQGGAVVDPFYIPAKTGALLPRVSLAVTHEDNVFLDPKEPKTGTSITLVPGLMAIWGRPSENHLYADYGLIIPVYESERELNDRPSHLLKLGGVYRTGKSQIQGQLGYRLLEELDTALGARVAKQDYIGDLNAEHRISGKSSAGILGRVEMHDFDSDSYADYDRYYGAARLYRRMNSKSESFLQAGLGRDEPREAAESAIGADFYDLSLGVRGKQSPKFNASGRLGYMWRRYDDERRAEFAHWIASLKAESNPFGLTTFTGELYADIRPAVDANGFDAVDQGFIGTVSRRLFSERVRGTASFTLGRIDYSGRQQTDSATNAENSRVYDGRSDDYWGFTLGVDWWTREHVSIGLAYSYMERNGAGSADAAAQEDVSYEYGRWTLRASWNY
jgi:hypothetical protein